MKKQKDYTIELLLFIFLIACLCSCSPKMFSGEVTNVNGDTVCLPKQCFKLLGNAPKTKIGNKAVFRETKNKNLVNCIRIK